MVRRMIVYKGLCYVEDYATAYLPTAQRPLLFLRKFFAQLMAAPGFFQWDLQLLAASPRQLTAAPVKREPMIFATTFAA